MEQGEVIQEKKYFKCNMDNEEVREFPRGPMDKNPSADAGDTCLNPYLGRLHMPWSN